MSSGDVFDISSALERHGLKNFRRRLIILSCLVTFFDGFDMNVIAFLTDPLSSTFHLTQPMMGNVFSSGIFGTLLGGFLFGYIGDLIGRRPAIIGP
jgi:AAHS family 4-hydroxybenzoate transporter-like MFS transporter